MSRLTRRSPRLAALLLVEVIVALSACGSATESGGDGDTTGTPASNTSSSPGALPVRDDLVDPRVVPWRTWRATGDRTLEFTVTAGPADCYGAEPELVETDAVVRVRIRVGLLPQAAGKECSAIAMESVVPVRLAAPLGTREVEHLT
jgi:hypothetical protein